MSPILIRIEISHGNHSLYDSLTLETLCMLHSIFECRLVSNVYEKKNKVKYLCFLLYVPNPDNIVALTLRNVNKAIMEETTFSFIFLAINQYVL